MATSLYFSSSGECEVYEIVASPSLALNKNAPTCIMCRITYKFAVLPITIVN
jgi:hypothetical protein